MVAAGLVLIFRFTPRLAVVVAEAWSRSASSCTRSPDAIDHSVGERAPAGVSGRDWVIVPTELAHWVPPLTYIGLIAAVLGLTLVHGWVRTVLLVPVLYLAAFVWENVMLAKPEPTRYIVLGSSSSC